MTRTRKPRRVRFTPEVTYFKPRGVTLASLEEVNLKVEELEALRLVDLEGLGQKEAAARMDVSQSTLHRVLASAHQKVSEALVSGKAIKVEGGDYEMAPFGLGRGGGRGRAPIGGGRGRMGGPFAAGPGGTCVCPACGAEVAHQAGVPCYQAKCSKCGTAMVRKR